MEDILLAIYFMKRKTSLINIFIAKDNEVLPWKKLNKNMSIAVEYDFEILMKSLYSFIV